MKFDYIDQLLKTVYQKRSEMTDIEAPFVIAIDGRAASGKTTLADYLSAELGASLIRMDDFFLPPELRSGERYGTPGGNVHKERFIEEVLPFIKTNTEFSYRRFDCHAMKYAGSVSVPASIFRIVEGSYSLHPDFGRYADLTIFLSLEKEEQLKRIAVRNGEAAAQVFMSKWIPLEEAYFSAFHIAENADMIIDTSSS